MRRGIRSITATRGTWVLWVSGVLVTAALLLSQAAGAAEERTLSIYNIHTKETVTATYKRDGEYLPDGLEKLNHVMRDWRRDEATEMDPELVDLVWQLHRDLGSEKPVHLISGYRSRKTNDRLRRKRGGQARNSRHILGKAADIHFPDVNLKRLRNSALVREAGGVGYYPKSGIPFVHVDTGRVRHWPRLPRMELAALFPSGETQHRPRDGRPITLADARKAVSSGKFAGPPQPVTTVAAARTTTREAVTRRPPVMTASLAAPLSMPIRLGDITGALAKQPATPADEKTPELMKLASLGAAAINTDTTSAPATPPVERVVVEPRQALEEDTEHPEELSYEPVAVLPLMQDTLVSRDNRMVALTAPDHANIGYLLLEPDRGLVLPVRRETGIRRLATTWQFSGPAVRNLVAESKPAKPEYRPSNRYIAATSPRTSASPRGATAMSFGFQ